MDSIIYGVIILAITAVLIAPIVYVLRKRSKRFKPVDTPLTHLSDTGLFGKVLVWTARILIVLMVLSITGAFVFRSIALVSLTGTCLGLYLLNGIIYRIVVRSKTSKDNKVD